MKMIWHRTIEEVNQGKVLYPSRRECGATQRHEEGRNLVSVVDVGVRQRPGHQLEQHHPVAVDVRLKGVGVAVLHADDLRSLPEERKTLQHQRRHNELTPRGDPVDSPSTRWSRWAAPPAVSRSTGT